MASIGDVATELRAAIATAEDAIQTLKTADDLAAQALSPRQSALADSASPDAHEGLTQLASARERLDEALTLIAAANETMTRYIASIAGIGSHSPGSISGSAITSVPSNRMPERAAHHRRYDPDKAEPILPFIGRRKTVGALYINGVRVRELLWSGEAGPAADTAGVKPQWALKSSVRTHTEGHAAAVVRSGRAPEAEVYINRAVCDVDPDGCIQRIPEVLPPGATLRVFDVTRPESRPVILKGTGEGLTDGDQ